MQPSFFLQKLFNLYIHLCQNQSFFGRLLSRILLRIRSLVLVLGDGLVQYQLGDQSLYLPFSHELPIIRQHLPLYSTNLVRLASITSEKYVDLTIVDIGGNVGDSAAMLRANAVKAPILCIEGDEEFFLILAKNAKAMTNVSVQQSYVGDAKYFHGSIASVGGTARLVNQIDAHEIKLTSLEDILCNHQDFSQSKLLKIDTDGFDTRIIRSTETWLSRAKPVIFFEYDPYFLAKLDPNACTIFSFLKKLGYSDVLIYDNVGDFLLRVEISNIDTLLDIDAYFSGRGGQRYCDIAVFHKADQDLCNKVRNSELAFFRKVRPIPSLNSY